MGWDEVQALATVVSDVALIGSLLFVLAQLKQQEREQFVQATSDEFTVWEDDDFQRALQWVLYDLKASTWREFVAKYRGEYGERAFNRVGALFNRYGYLMAHDLLGGLDQLVLDTLSGPAIAVWNKIEPLVLEARLIENSTMFQDFQTMLPACYACYVPGQQLPPRERRELEEASHAAITGAETLLSPNLPPCAVAGRSGRSDRQTGPPADQQREEGHLPQRVQPNRAENAQSNEAEDRQHGDDRPRS